MRGDIEFGTAEVLFLTWDTPVSKPEMTPFGDARGAEATQASAGLGQ